MPHLGNVNGASLVPDFSPGVNAIAQGLQFKQRQDAAAEQQSKANILIDSLKTAETPGDEEKIFLDLAKIVKNPQELAGIRSIMEKGNEQQLPATKLQSEEATKFFNSLAGIKDHAGKIKAIRERVQFLMAKKGSVGQQEQADIDGQIAKLFELSEKSPGELDVAVFRGQVLNSTVQQGIAIKDARLKQQALAQQAEIDRIARISLLASQLPPGEQFQFLNEQFFESQNKNLPTNEIQELRDSAFDQRSTKFQTNINRARKVEDVVKPPKLTKGEPGDVFFDPQGNIAFNVPGAEGGVDVAKASPKDFTGESLTKAAGPGGSFSDLELRPEIKNKLNKTGKHVTGDSTLFKDTSGQTFIATPVTDKTTGDTKVNVNKITAPTGEAGTVASRALGETPAEKQAREVVTAGGKTAAELSAEAQGRPDVISAETRTKGTEGRVQKSIQDGIDASKSLAPLKRSLDLVNIVGTGKPQEAILKFQQLFGFAPADETELQSALQIEVLKQIRPIFGAQPSKEEGLILLDLNTNFGKSTEGNIRLLKRTMALVNERVGVGLKDAEFAGDQNAIDRINRAMEFEIKEFEINPKDQGGLTQQQQKRLQDLRLKQGK